MDNANGSERRWKIARWVATIATLLYAGPGLAQRPKVEVQAPPYYVGEPVTIFITLSDIQDGGTPTCELADTPPAELQVQGPKTSQSSQSYTTIVNGRLRSSQTSSYQFAFEATANVQGDYEVGPFALNLGGQKWEAQAIPLSFEQLESDPDMSIEVSLPSDTFYVGQRIPTTIRWGFAPDTTRGQANTHIQHAYQNLEIRSPFFDQFEIVPQEGRTETPLFITTARGRIEAKAEVSQETQDGKPYIFVTGKLTVIGNTPARYDSLPVTCRTKRVRGFRRSFLSVEPVGTRPALAQGEPISLTIRPLPTQGRPESFAGAVGEGYSIDVAANRSVVRVGDPISLSVSIRGDGGLEKLSLPPLSADGGMPPDLFQLPNDAPPGNFDGKTKQFKVNVRVQNETVTQIPELAFSWFDPKIGEYRTARSKPIALQVMPAQVVGAADVVSAVQPLETSSEKSAATTGTEERQAGSDQRPAYDLASQGANLAIEQDMAKLLPESQNVVSQAWLQYACYGLGIAAVLAAVVVRKRGEVDPQIALVKQQKSDRQRQLVAAAKLPVREAAVQIASVLRAASAESNAERREQLGKLISECETVVYSPTASSEPSAQDLSSRAQALLDRS